MDNSDEMDAAYKEVLYKVGRNVVLYARIEALLKYLIANSSICGTPQTLLTNLEEQKKAVEKNTLGNLTGQFVKKVYVAENRQTEEQKELTEATASMELSFSIPSDDETRQKRVQILKNLVEERNKLIHHELARLNPKSVEDCERVGAKLDDQFSRILPEFEKLRALVKAIRDSHAYFSGIMANENLVAEMLGLRMREYFKVTEAGASEEMLKKLQQQLGYNLPTMYLSFLQETNGAEWGIHDKEGDCLNLWKVQNVPEWSENYLQDWLPDCVLIGSDGGGRGIVLDRRATDNPDHWTVYRVDFGDLDRDEMVWVADSFLEWACREFRLPD